MSQLLIRCSSLGKIMAEPTAAAKKNGEVLSVGAKTYVRKLAAESIFGVDFTFSSKQTEKGNRVEQDGIDLLNRVWGRNLTKNTERKADGFISGECDLYDAERREGHDLKCPWSVATFPLVISDCIDSDYEYQCRGYMSLWDADQWHVQYALVNTPDDLIGFEPLQLHLVSHIPEHHRITSWTIKRDLSIEVAIREKVRAAREYFKQVVAEFDSTHQFINEEETA